jgi:hypothetical protein
MVGEHPREIFKRSTAVSQQTSRSAAIKCDDTGLNTYIGCLSEENRVNAPVKLLKHMVGGGGGETPETICARRSNRRARRTNERERRLVPWEAHTNGVEPGPHETRNLRPRSGNDREGTWPEGIRKDRDARIYERIIGEEAGEIGAFGNVHDERVKGWAALRLKDACDSRRVKRICSESVDGLCGEGEKATSPNDRCGARHRIRCRVRGARG